MRAVGDGAEHRVTIAPPVDDHQRKLRKAVTQSANTTGDHRLQVDPAIENQHVMRAGCGQPVESLFGISRGRNVTMNEFAPDDGSETASAK
ncbi:hypothetical protein ATE76_16190 [Sphingopyxis sp. H093]|nr:hypothetical protein ATE76_16190 [Sphingopyxis sp. H093]